MIRHLGVNMAIWQRDPQPAALPALEALLNAKTAIALDVNDPDVECLQNMCMDIIGQDFTRYKAITVLAEDIVMLAQVFREVVDTDNVRVRFERIEDDGCRLFHADSLRVRMLCTYAGPGTEWLDADNARPRELGLRGRSIEEANSAIVVDPARVRHLPAWHVAVFSGRLRSDTPPLIHRSAPVRCQKDHRIRLCLDLPESCSC